MIDSPKDKQRFRADLRNVPPKSKQQQQRQFGNVPALQTDSEDDHWNNLEVTIMNSDCSDQNGMFESDSSESEEIILNATENTFNSIKMITNYLDSDSNMDELTDDSVIDEMDSLSDCNDDVMNQVLTMQDYHVISHNIKDNNITFEEEKNARVVLLQEYDYDLNILDLNQCTSAIHYNNNVTESNVIIIQSSEEDDGVVNLINNVTTTVKDGNVILNSKVKYEIEDNIHNVYGKEIIKDTNDQWIITVPIQNENGTVTNTRICADPGANSACVDTQWAMDNFGNMICRNKGRKKMDTPGGIISPKYCLWMTFPTNSGIQLMRKMYLVDNLPVKVLADINMLKAFGYKFRDETPPIFKHKPKDEPNYELRDDFMEIVGNHRVNYFVKDYSRNKVIRFINYLRQDGFSYMKNINNDDFNERFNKFILPQMGTNYGNNDGIKFEVVKQDYTEEEKHIIDYDKINPRDIYEIESENSNVMKMINFINKQSIGIFRFSPQLHQPTRIPQTTAVNVIRRKYKERCPIFKRCLFLMSKQSYLANDDEIEEAMKLVDNKKLEFNDLSYLKQYGKKYGTQWNGLYNAIMKWIKNNGDIFAKHQFDRRTMNVPPARLGINEDERDTVMYAPQYPINAKKRLFMINYTLMNKNNGFWKKIKYSLHCIPYTMIPKRKNGEIYLYRPAFDARVINQFCTLIPIIMPTIKDFRELHSIRGFVTMADFKNFFDCIPLHPDDRKYAVVHTPLGLFQMSCLTYGFINSASVAQAIVNPIAIYIGDCLIYIDDICIKHRLENGVFGVINQLNRMAEKIRLINGYLNPSKFYPACDYSEGFGWQNTMLGTICSDSYKRKMLAVTKPTTKKEIQSFSGLINYMNNNIYNCKIIMYWINRLEEATDSKGKHKRVKWTKEANLAWEQIRWLIANLPLLHHPTLSGTFCLQTDACNYGVGGVLWQRQINEDNNKYQWNIIDMHSKVVPKGLRKCNVMILEAYAIAVCCEHWSFHLKGKEFIISTDNMPIANVFGKKWKELTTATQKTLENFRSRIADLEWESYHIPGLNNPIADGLSRFTLKLINEDKAKPPDQQQYPLQLNGIYGDDLDTPTLTEDERKHFIENESKKLENKKKDLIDSNSVMLLKCIDSNNITMRIKSNQVRIDPLDKSWNNSIMNIRNNIFSKDNLRMNQLIYSLDDLILRSDESNSHNKLITNELENNYVLLLCNIYKNRTKYRNKLLIMNNLIEKEIFQNYSDSLQLSNVNIIQQVKTRSQTRKAKQKHHLPEPQQQKRKYSKGNENFQNIRYAIDTRKELMMKLFGNVKDKNMLQLDRFFEYQKSDNLLCTISDLYDRPKDQWNRNDLQLIKDWDNVLYKKLIKNKIKRRSSILMVQVFDKVLNKEDLKFIVPFTIIGDLLIHYHHSYSNFHLSYNQMLLLIRKSFWWSTMNKDIKDFSNSCILCQQLRGTQRSITPLQIRLNPPTFSHIFADFMGPIFGRFYVLVFVDQRSGLCRLIPTDGCDALTVLESLIAKWITLFGYPRLFESDWGSGFNNRLMNTFAELTGMKIEIAEPRYHRSIGKVERTIGILQNIIAKYNIALNKQLSNNIDIDEAWQTIEVLLPHIQFNMNQFKSRISGLSSNEIAFGRQFNDSNENMNMLLKLKQLKKENELILSKSDYNDFAALLSLMENVNKKFINDWKNYVWLSRKEYNTKHNITLDKINKYRKKFDIGEEILYFIGDKQVIRENGEKNGQVHGSLRNN